jgi:hypothetical protein
VGFQFSIHFPLFWPFGLRMPHQRIEEPSLYKTPTHSLDGRRSDVEHLSNLLIGPGWSLRSLICFE